MTLPPNPLKKLSIPFLICVLLAVALSGCEVSETGGQGHATEEDTSDTSDSTNTCRPEDDPSRTCMDTGCPTGQVCKPSDITGCVPSHCACEGGDWMCTADCGQPMACVTEGEPSACTTPDPSQSCLDTGCPTGEVCAPSGEGCRPSACGCDEESGQWICTADCGQPMACVPASACEGPNPAQSCLDTGCPRGEVCEPSGDDGCRPSSCGCDEESGHWICTEDCQQLMHCAPSGGACDTPDPSETCLDTGCPEGQTCERSLLTVCVPSSCFCDEATGGWACTDDCGPHMACTPSNPQACDTPDPSETCLDTGCAEGQLCVLAPTDQCVPSECFCDATTGDWVCTRDCLPAMICEASACGAYPVTCTDSTQCGEGFVCNPQPWDAPPPCCQCEAGQWFCTDDCLQTTGCKPPQQCEGPNPAEDCMDTGCPRGEECVPSDAEVCVPSACGCDATTGDWICTADCGQPMVCAPISPPACTSPNPAEDCDDLGCPEGQECVPSMLTVCVPSSCSCDATTGDWICTDDCDSPMVCQ